MDRRLGFENPNVVVTVRGQQHRNPKTRMQYIV